MSNATYRWPAMLLHWLQAILVFVLLWLGWQMVDLPKGAERTAAYGLHKSLGLLMLALIALRLFYRRRHAPPPPLPGVAWEQVVARWVHRGLYVFLLLAPLSGYLMVSFTQYPLKFFGWGPLPKAGFPDEGLNALFRSLHFATVWTGAMLLALHLAGVLRHVQRAEPILRRMLPARLLRS